MSVPDLKKKKTILIKKDWKYVMRLVSFYSGNNQPYTPRAKF
jgi:hypothetical protein